MKKPTFVVRQCFSSHTEFKDAVREYAMNEGVPISWKKNEKARVRAVIIGTPAQTPSRVEFQPQCVKNPPVAGCDKIST
ncbi:hypothetical protein RJ640_024075 [Escallonia rubra]|uniref:Uncharacterized protein n=1 Tax=Escallonia rubra TaxID=112253 RepID=A0AA88S6F9_9ASTE|nr:hypothetical protein RJ640_024075 [Escallonia rubra]